MRSTIYVHLRLIHTSHMLSSTVPPDHPSSHSGTEYSKYHSPHNLYPHTPSQSEKFLQCYQSDSLEHMHYCGKAPYHPQASSHRPQHTYKAARPSLFLFIRQTQPRGFFSWQMQSASASCLPQYHRIL